MTSAAKPIYMTLVVLLNPIFFAEAVIRSIADGMITKSLRCLGKKRCA